MLMQWETRQQKLHVRGRRSDGSDRGAALPSQVPPSECNQRSYFPADQTPPRCAHGVAILSCFVSCVVTSDASMKYAHELQGSMPHGAASLTASSLQL